MNDNEKNVEAQSTELISSKATFVVQVKYRQNRSWQGTVKWVDQERTQNFRSTFQLLKLMDEAIQGDLEPDIQWE